MNLFQFLREGIKFAFQAIGASRMRAFLTMLGVATGIFAITGILTMVNSLQTSITNNISALGNTTLFVHHFPWKDNGDDWFKFFNRPKVSFNDYQKLKKNLDRVSGVSFEASIGGQMVRAGGRGISGISVVGTTEDFGIIKEIEFSEGRYFSEIEHHLGSSVCMVGYNIAESLFPDSPALNQYIRVKGRRLRVVGVVSKQGASMFFGGGSDDDKVFLPYRVIAKMYNVSRRSIEKVVTIKAATYEDLAYVEDETIGIVRAARGLKPRAEDNFAINKQEALMNQFEVAFGFLKTGGWVISIFSILIGGFSIGNIMYISVRERTNEIGIQKSLGATKGFILYQFLAEAVLICLLGGLLGLGAVFGIGFLAQWIFTHFDLPMQVYFSFKDIMTGLGLSVGIGILSGFIPSLIAASLDPVIAIRQS